VQRTATGILPEKMPFRPKMKRDAVPKRTFFSKKLCVGAFSSEANTGSREENEL
jgi:hypothetical protein